MSGHRLSQVKVRRPTAVAPEAAARCGHRVAAPSSLSSRAAGNGLPAAQTAAANALAAAGMHFAPRHLDSSHECGHAVLPAGGENLTWSRIGKAIYLLIRQVVPCIRSSYALAGGCSLQHSPEAMRQRHLQ
jgi:hypothetical protein